MITVKIIEIATIISGLSQPENKLLASCPMNAPATAMVSFPKKYDRKNFAGLYFIRPSGITTGSSGSGEAATRNSSGIAQRLIFAASASRRACLFELRCPLTKKVTI